MENDLRYCHHDHGNAATYWEYDAKGIPLVNVCDKCRSAKLATFRKDVLNDPNYYADEPIEAEDY